MRNKKDRQKPKELWPGARFWLDCAKITGNDFDKVERWLKEIGDTKEQLINLLKLKEYVGNECDKIARQIREAGQKDSSSHSTGSIDSARRYIEQAQAFGARLTRKIEQLRNLQLIQDQLSGALASLEPESPPLKDKHRTIARCVLALHYLLLEAGMSYATVDKTIVARFVSALTGYGYSNVYTRIKDKLGKNQKVTRQDLAVVREWFESLGLSEIAKQIEAERNMGVTMEAGHRS